MKLAKWPYYDEQTQTLVCEVLQSGEVNYWTGSRGRQFEDAFAEKCQSRFGIALANGSVALEVALIALGVGPGDEVIVPCRTFVATALSVVRVGARPIIVDIGPDQNIQLETIQQAWTPRTKAVIAVHLAGMPCDMPAIKNWVKSRGYLVEDCAQAHAARIADAPVGSFGDVACFSFCQDKIMSTGGEGGMLVTNDKWLWERAWSCKDHGKNFERLKLLHPPGYRFIHDSVGTNFRMTEMQAAIGLYQLSLLDEWVEKRNQHAQQLNKIVDSTDVLTRQTVPFHCFHAYYKYYAFLKPEHAKFRPNLIQRLNQKGIPIQSGACQDVSLEQSLKSYGFGERLVADALGSTSLMLPVHPTLTEEQVQWMGETLVTELKLLTCNKTLVMV